MQPAIQDKIKLSGGAARHVCSAAAGYLPVSLKHVPAAAFASLPVFLRSGPDSTAEDPFVLYRGENMVFTEPARQRLVNSGVGFVYIRLTDQARFREQAEAALVAAVSDTSRAAAEKSAMIYATSLELVNELLARPDSATYSARLENVSRAVATLVLSDADAFSQLFAASHHDFYTATHMVNVGTWMVAIAYAMGQENTDELARICQAGMVHDIGKMFIPEDLLNKRGPLSDADWAAIRRHPELGAAHLQSCGQANPLVLAVAREHHERQDGSGYPACLTGKQLHPASRICAVADSFDAMTAFRPFKRCTMTIADAVQLIQKEAPGKYDGDVVAAWLKVLEGLKHAGQVPEAEGQTADLNGRRTNKRYKCFCPARVHVLQPAGGALKPQPGIQVTLHSVSQLGLAFLSLAPYRLDEHVRIYLTGPSWTGRFIEGLTVRCRRYSDRWYDVGVSLFSPGEGPERARPTGEQPQ